MMELRKVDAKNLWDIVALSVAPEQERFVASNTASILEAYAAIASGGVALPYGVYDGDVPVGFLMIGYGCDDWPDAPEIARQNYSLWRFMIDRRHQGRGYGKAALRAALDLIRTRPCGDAVAVWLSYDPENAAAKKLYHAFGFRENGEMDGGEVIAVLPLDPEQGDQYAD